MDELKRATLAYQRAKRSEVQARTALHLAIVAALNRGVTQVEVVRVTGYTRERIRQIAKAAE
jgi:hypothetical protein